MFLTRKKFISSSHHVIFFLLDKLTVCTNNRENTAGNNVTNILTMKDMATPVLDVLSYSEHARVLTVGVLSKQKRFRTCMRSKYSR